jgi:hypothetical protein
MPMYDSYQDIPQFPRSDYSITAFWSSLERQINNLSAGVGRLDMDPPYQRGYVWTDPQKERYVEYILMGGASGRDLYFNCPNWDLRLPLDSGVWENTVEVVDGKQRIDAILGFIRGDVLAFGKPASGYSGVLRNHVTKMTMHVCQIRTRLEVVDWYLGMNNGGTAHSQNDLDVAKAYRDSLIAP